MERKKGEIERWRRKRGERSGDNEMRDREVERKKREIERSRRKKNR